MIDSINNGDPIQCKSIRDNVLPFVKNEKLINLIKDGKILNTVYELHSINKEKVLVKKFIPIQYAGVTIHYDEKSDLDIAHNKFANILTKLYENDLLDFGFLAPPMSLELLNIGDEDYKRLMFISYFCPSESVYDIAIEKNPKDISRTIKNYINSKIGHYINEEGALPKNIIDLTIG
jgi:hypothetical protein